MSRARKLGKAVRYASRTTGVNFEKWLTWGAIAGGFYFLAKIAGAGAAAKKALNETGGAIGRTLYDWFHPNTEGETTFFTVKFPDGSFHAVPSGRVNAQGIFTHSDDKRYRIAISSTVFVRPNGIPAGNKFAVIVP